jgi:CRP-like cAMP-binding protein
MVLGPTRTHTNDLLERLPARDRKAVLAACDEIEVEVGQLIYAEGGRIPYAYFPIDSMFSELSPSAIPAVEAFLTGHEGMVGFALALDARFAPMECSVQGSGQALRMKAAVFRDLVASLPSLRDQAFSSALYQMQQTARNVYCVRHHEIQHRLARWLLMAADRHRSPRFDVTHKFLAAMLGTRRAGVTVAATGLQARRLIRYRRGEMEILDRKGLEGAACDCYAFSLRAHRMAFRR